MRSPLFRLLVLLSLTTFIAVGCAKDPSEDVPAAETSEPEEIPEEEEAAEGDEGEGEEAAEEEAEEAAGDTIELAINAENSAVGFIGSKVTGSHEGQFNDFSGTIKLPGSADITEASVEVNIVMDSVTSDNERLTGHLKSEDFFDVAQFPNATFISTAIAEGAEGDATHTVTGNLELHGVTRGITFPATIAVTDEAASLNAEFSINRMDFGIVYAGQADDLIREGVVIKLNLEVPR